MFTSAVLQFLLMIKSKRKSKEVVSTSMETARHNSLDKLLRRQVDPKTGALNIKKGERWINTFTPIVTFLLRCNTDVTSLLSGTAIKAIVAYISTLGYPFDPSIR